VTADPSLLRLLAGLLDYPGADLAARAGECAGLLEAAARPGAARLRRFAADAARGTAALEEAYTAAFDVAALASPYVGDQLFGAGAERARLLSALRELQREAGVAAGPELPDHVAELLRLAAAPIPGDVRDDLVREGLEPVLAKMREALEAARNPWAEVVAAVLDGVAGSAEAHPARALEVAP
jgi:nitrate reductase delta subunit